MGVQEDSGESWGGGGGGGEGWGWGGGGGGGGGGGAHTECGVLQALLIGRPERIVLRKKEPWAWLPGYRHVVDDTGNVKVL